MGKLKNIAAQRVRVERSAAADTEDGIVHGIASVEEPDRGKLLIRIDGIEFPPAVPIVFEHTVGGVNVRDIVGEAQCYVARSADDKPALMFRGKFYTSRKPIARELYDTALAMHEAGDNLSLYVSVDGTSPPDSLLVHKEGELAGVAELKTMKLDALAVTSSPMNGRAAWGPGEDWLPVAASLAAPEAFNVLASVLQDDHEAGLRGLLDTTFRVARSTQQAHWNVRGPTFSQLHELFGEQYDELNGAVDDIAERIRAINVLRSVAVADQGLVAFQDFAPAEEMVSTLAALHENCAMQAKVISRAAERNGDAATVDLAGRRAVAHEKAAWMLRSTQAPGAAATPVQRSGVGYPTQGMGATSSAGAELGVLVASNTASDASNRRRDLDAFTMRLLKDYPWLSENEATVMTRELIARLTRRAP